MWYVQNVILTSRITEVCKTLALLISLKVDPNMSNVPQPAIILALFSGDVELVKMLLEAGANPNARMLPEVGFILFYCTVTVQVGGKLIHWSTVLVLSIIGTCNTTALLMDYCWKCEVIRHLYKIQPPHTHHSSRIWIVTFSSDIILSQEGWLTPLHILCLAKPQPSFPEIMDLLLEHGADPNARAAVSYKISHT